MTITLTHSITTDPDFGGWNFYISSDNPDFDQDIYAEAYGLDVNDLDPKSVKSVRDAASLLDPGEYLFVTHDA